MRNDHAEEFDGKAGCRAAVGQTRNSVTCVTIEQLQRLQAELQRLAERANGLDPADCDPRRVCHLIGEPPTVSLG